MFEIKVGTKVSPCFRSLDVLPDAFNAKGGCSWEGDFPSSLPDLDFGIVMATWPLNEFEMGMGYRLDG